MSPSIPGRIIAGDSYTGENCFKFHFAVLPIGMSPAANPFFNGRLVPVNEFDKAVRSWSTPGRVTRVAGEYDVEFEWDSEFTNKLPLGFHHWFVKLEEKDLAITVRFSSRAIEVIKNPRLQDPQLDLIHRVSST